MTPGIVIEYIRRSAASLPTTSTSVSPSMYSMTTHGASSCSSIAWMAQTLGWFSDPRPDHGAGCKRVDPGGTTRPSCLDPRQVPRLLMPAPLRHDGEMASNAPTPMVGSYSTEQVRDLIERLASFDAMTRGRGVD